MVPHAPPLQAGPLTLHVTARLELPVTVAVNGWVVPTVTFALVGDTVIATPAELETFRVALLLTTLPTPLLTPTVNSVPLSEVDVEGVVYVEEVAPLIAAPFFCHW
jgi:hypothetical protein